MLSEVNVSSTGEFDYRINGSGGKQRYFKHYKKEKTLDMCHMNVDKPNSLISCHKNFFIS